LNDEDLSYIIKSGLDGRTLCSDTFNISFNTSDFAPYTNMTYNLRYEGMIQPQFIKPYMESLEPLKLADCSPESCCKDELVYKYDTICEGSSYILPDGTTVTEPGIYAAQFNTITGCDSIIYTYLSVTKPYPLNFSLGNDTCLVNNAPVTFILPSDGAVQYRWQDGSVSSTYTANFPGEYWVKASAACNSATDSVKIYDNCAQAIFIPSAFTPNKDALNDIFRIIDMKGQRLINFNIYNRYGQLVFATADARNGWDGSISNIPQPSGTYVYFVRYIDLAGKPHQLKGTVVLIR
jgi:gliding motility-associated-like protein